MDAKNIVQYGRTLDLIDRAVYFRDEVLPKFISGEVSALSIPVDHMAFDESEFCARSGLCYNLSLDSYIPESQVHELFKSWEFFSNDLLFPIPDPYHMENESVKMHMARNAYFYTSNVYEGLYGEYRVHLLNHIINSLRASVKGFV